MDDRPDEEGESDRPHAEGPAHEDADDEDHDLDSPPSGAYRRPASRDGGHQAIARTGAEVRSYVHARGKADDEDSAHHHHDIPDQRLGCREKRSRDVYDHPDDQGIEQRPYAISLVERDPCEEDDERDDDRPHAHAQPELLGETLMQHIPWRQAQSGSEHEADAYAEEDQADQELYEPAAQILATHGDEHAGDANKSPIPGNRANPAGPTAKALVDALPAVGGDRA